VAILLSRQLDTEEGFQLPDPTDTDPLAASLKELRLAGIEPGIKPEHD